VKWEAAGDAAWSFVCISAHDQQGSAADTAATTRGNCIPPLFRGDSTGFICNLKVRAAPLIDVPRGELHALAACESVLTKCFDADPRWSSCSV